METRANYVLVGLFAVAGFAGILAFFLWFANIQLDRQFAYYDVDFANVSGLTNASDVRFAGLPVGRVVDVGLSPAGDGLVRVRLEIAAPTPVREDSVATIEALGVTGVSFVSITAGTPTAPLLLPDADGDVPRIDAGRSVLESLSQDAPDLLAETLGIVRDLREVIGGGNQRRVETILSNVERASGTFAEALDDFSEVTESISGFAVEIERFNTMLDSFSEDARAVLSGAETALGAIDGLTADARGVLAEGSATLAQATSALETAESYIAQDLGAATDQVRRSVGEAEARLVSVSAQIETMLATFSATGQRANDRLAQLEATIASTDRLIAALDGTAVSVGNAAVQVEALVRDGATPLVADLRSATAQAAAVLQSLQDATQSDLPEIMAAIRRATQTASQTIADVAGNLDSASTRVDGLTISAEETLDTVRTTFADANGTLTRLNTALETGDRALLAAEAAFSSADRVLGEEVGAMATQLRGVLQELEVAIGAVAQDVPDITADLRAASLSAEAAFAEIARTVGETAPALRSFGTTGLPQYSRLAVETRALIANLDALVEQIRRNPGRFLLDPRAPEFRR